MGRVAIVSYDVQTVYGKAGGVGAFTTRWASLLRKAGETVTIVLTRVDWKPMRVDPPWRAWYRTNGISLIELQAPSAPPNRWPEVPTMRMAEIAAPVLRGFDIVYVQDWGNTAFHLLRERRYSRQPGPVCVTVLHGPSEWELSGNGKYPDLPGDLHLAWQERYAAGHSDFVASPSRYMATELAGRGWEFPGGVEVCGLPMPEPEPPVPNRSAAETARAQIRRIVYFGRAEERKGIRTFVAAMRRFGKTAAVRPEVILLGAAGDGDLLQSSLADLKEAGFAASHKGSLDSDGARKFLAERAQETLCVIPGSPDNFPYAVVETSLIDGLNVIACRGGGVPEILPGTDAWLCDPAPGDLADKIAERVRAPLAASELPRYDCKGANRRWLEFHGRAAEKRATQTARMPPAQPLSVDVCVTYYRKPAYLPQLVDALERQTESDFHTIVVNDGSPDEESNRVFAEQAARTAGRGWDFFGQPNAFVDAARNSAARRGSGDLILFVDADDVPALNAIARMREAMALSGDDALICASYLFAGDQLPFDLATGEVTAPAYATCIPLGMDLVGGILNPAAFGGSMFIIRRSVFEKMGGFRELRGAGHEDWEFYVRTALAGYRIDVLPEMLQYYRQLENSLARTLPSEASKRRLLDAYEDALKTAGLGGSALALAGLYRGCLEMEKKIRRLSVRAAAPRSRYAFFSAVSASFQSNGPWIERLRLLYRGLAPLETRLRLHRIFLAPFVGPYKPPSS